MDSIINAGEQYLRKHQANEQQGGQSLGGNNAFGGNYPAGGNYNDDDDLQSAQQHASNHAGSSGNNEIFSSILGAITQKKGQLANEDIDEGEAIQAHKNNYGSGGDDNASSNSLGSAAAMQALKLFNQGETGGKQGQGAFVGLAMAEASKLFDNKASEGKVSSDASKESAVQQAGEMALKMYMKSQAQSQGGLMGLASKFM